MKRRLFAVALATLWVWGCGVQEPEPDAPAAPAPVPRAETSAVQVTEGPSGCNAQARIDWSPTETASYGLVATSIGETCDAAKIEFVMETLTGKRLYSATYEAKNLPVVFGEAVTRRDMRDALAAWIDPKQNTSFSTTADLPEWQDGQEQPLNGDFPFYPQDGITPVDYAFLRTESRPVLCYVQGSQDMACLAVSADGGAVSLVGRQAFPG
jgi:hypothetical protein